MVFIISTGCSHHEDAKSQIVARIIKNRGQNMGGFWLKKCQQLSESYQIVG